MSFVDFIHALSKLCLELIIFQSPVGCKQPFLGRLRYVPFDKDVVTQTPAKRNDQIDVFVYGKQTKPFGVCLVLTSHRRMTDNLQLMQFKRSNG